MITTGPTAAMRSRPWGKFVRHVGGAVTVAVRRRKLVQAFALHRADLLTHDAQPREMAAQFRAGVLRHRGPFRRAQAFELLLGFAQGRLEGEMKSLPEL